MLVAGEILCLIWLGRDEEH